MTQPATQRTPVAADTPIPPSGRQHEIRFGGQVATVVEVGGGLRDYHVDGQPVLDGFGVDEMCSSARGTTLAPWPNRLRDGSYEFDGVAAQAPLSEPEKHNAIHGFVRWRPWELVESSEHRVSVAVTLHPLAGYPFALALTNTFELSDDGLTVTTTATNVGATRCPFALGFHPYLKPSGELVDGDVLTIPAATYLPTDDRGLPTGRVPVDGEHDFRRGRPVGDTELDLTFTDLTRNAAGEAVVTFASADGSRCLAVWADDTFPYFELFTGDSLPDAARRRHGLGVEPMTAPPNALQSGTDLVTIEPGQTSTHRWGIRPDGGR